MDLESQMADFTLETPRGKGKGILKDFLISFKYIRRCLWVDKFRISSMRNPLI